MNDNKSTVIIPLHEFSYEYKGPSYIRGEGMFLYDENGKKYIDTISGLWNVSFGYGKNTIADAVVEQVNQLPYINLYSSSTPVVEKYSNKLIDALQGDFTRLIYTCSGSESVECAIKLARKYQRISGRKERYKIAVFDLSYHGTTYAAMSASGIDQVESKQYGPMVEGFELLETPIFWGEKEDTDEFQKKCMEDIKNVLGDGSQIAAILMEPIIGSGGIIEIPDWYISHIFEFAKKHDILIIFDEVATGFGRTGELFAYLGMNVKPDVLCLSKGINNGVIPMGAVLVNSKIENVFLQEEQFIEHFSTQNGNPIACAAATEVLSILMNTNLLGTIKEEGTYLKDKLSNKLIDLPNVREVRGKGLMIGIDLVDSYGVPYTMEKLFEIENNLRKQGLLIYPFVAGEKTSGFNLFPAYVIGKRVSDRIVNLLYKVLSMY